MPPTDGLDELALMRFRGECGWSSSTAISGRPPPSAEYVEAAGLEELLKVDPTGRRLTGRAVERRVAFWR